MNFDIVMISTGSRPRLLQQSLRSLRENASDWAGHSLTLVLDGCSIPEVVRSGHTIPDRVIISTEQQGASRSRNIGASSTPSYLRKDMVMFLDDDFYAVKGWDSFKYPTDAVSSGHAHPYNLPNRVIDSGIPAEQTSVISTVHMVVPWAIWDEVGPFTEPGGAGGSEDVDWCRRFREHRFTASFWITTPQCFLHTGIGSSTGSKLVGWEQVIENNRRLEKVHGIEGKVIYG